MEWGQTCTNYPLGALDFDFLVDDEHGRRHRVVGVDDRNNVQADELRECGEKILPGLFVVEVRLCQKNLRDSQAILGEHRVVETHETTLADCSSCSRLQNVRSFFTFRIQGFSHRQSHQQFLGQLLFAESDGTAGDLQKFLKNFQKKVKVHSHHDAFTTFELTLRHLLDDRRQSAERQAILVVACYHRASQFDYESLRVPKLRPIGKSCLTSVSCLQRPLINRFLNKRKNISNHMCRRLKFNRQGRIHSSW